MSESIKETFEFPKWNYKESLFLEPFKCEGCEETMYQLFMKEHLYDDPVKITVTGKDDPEDFYGIAHLSVCDLYDLYWNICEKLDIEHARDDLKEQFQKEEKS